MNTQCMTMNQSLEHHHYGLGMPERDFRANYRLFAQARQVIRNRSSGLPVTIMSRADFIHHVTLHLPEVAALIEEEDFGILHLELGAMKLASLAAIARYEFYTLRRHFAFIAYLLEHAGRELRDAIQISYVEALFIGERGEAYEYARSILPDSLKDALKKAEKYYQVLEESHSQRIPALA